MAAGMTTDQATAPPSPCEARTAPAPTPPRRSRRARWIALALVGPLALLIGPDGVIVAKLVGGVRADDLDLLLQQANTSQPQKGRT